MNEYTLQHNTAEHTFTIDFGNGNELKHDANLQTAYLLKDGEVKDKFSTQGMLLETFEQIVSNIEKSLQ
jgi:hypothetical protein